LRQRDLTRQAVFAPILGAPKLAHRLIADNRECASCEIRAVLDDSLPRSAGAEAAIPEAARLVLYVEVERH
jgi:hypothetical protein